MAEMTFEQAMQRLEEIVSELERGDLTLEDSIKIYEEGLKLNRFCSAKLDETEKRIKKLVKDPDGFKLEETDLE